MVTVGVNPTHFLACKRAQGTFDHNFGPSATGVDWKPFLTYSGPRLDGILPVRQESYPQAVSLCRQFWRGKLLTTIGLFMFANVFTSLPSLSSCWKSAFHFAALSLSWSVRGMSPQLSAKDTCPITPATSNTAAGAYLSPVQLVTRFSHVKIRHDCMKTAQVQGGT